MLDGAAPWWSVSMKTHGDVSRGTNQRGRNQKFSPFFALERSDWKHLGKLYMGWDGGAVVSNTAFSMNDA